MKKFVGLAGSFGFERTSEKYSLRFVLHRAAARPANRVPVNMPLAASVVGSHAAEPADSANPADPANPADSAYPANRVFCRTATVLSGSLSPPGPVSMPRVFKTAFR